MNKFVHIILMISLSLLTLNVGATEVSTSKWKVVKEQLDKLEPGDLLVSDVMSVIYYQGDKIISKGHDDIFESFLKDVEEKSGKKRSLMLKGIAKQSFIPRAVSDELLDYMRSIVSNDSGIKFVILTSGRTGSLGPIDELMNLRLDRLSRLGINLKNMFDKKYIELSGLPKMKEGRPPVYNNGIIFANKNDKGDSLAAFLDAVEFHPNKIIFIDNQMRQIDSVKRMCEKRNIEFIGIHFTKIYELTEEPLDKSVMEKQFIFLHDCMIWLNDEQAKCMIDNNDDYQLCKRGG